MPGYCSGTFNLVWDQYNYYKDIIEVERGFSGYFALNHHIMRTVTVS